MSTEKQKLFCSEYVKDYNGTQAAIRAGYSAKTAASQASRLLKNPDVLKEIKENQKKLVDSLCITEEKIIKNLQDVYDRCMAAVPVTEWDYSEHKLVETGQYLFDSKGALKAIQLLGQHLGMFNSKESTANSNTYDGFIEALEKKAGEIEWEE